ncbi:MAG TPA: DUF4833 domain-containing protein [Polyangiaceae bacterium]|jgi:hypothetical protein
MMPTLALFIALDLSSVMFISKSENKNQVHYGAHIDPSCIPSGAAPVYAYWLMLEKGPNVTEPLLSREQRGYGIGHQEVHGDTVQVTLRGLPARQITIHVRRDPNGTCAGSAEMTISGLLARVFNVHLFLGFLHVKSVLITGWNAAGEIVRERFSP